MQLLEDMGLMASKREQSVGLASTLMSDISEKQSGGDTINLTPGLIQQIFAERPQVKRAYHRHVPADMDEKEFWLKYCKHQDAVEVHFSLMPLLRRVTNGVSAQKKRKMMIEGDVRGAQEIDDEFADLFETTTATIEDATFPITRDSNSTVDLISTDRELMKGYGLLHNQALADKVSIVGRHADH